jgi:hypothetical protein
MAKAEGWQAAWTGLSTRRRISILLVVAFALLLAAGASWSATNPRLNNYRPAVAEVVAVDREAPATITVRFTTLDDDVVEATTDRLTFVPPVGAPVAVLYDPADANQVAMDGYSRTSLITTVLLGLFAVALGTAWLTFRRRHEA